MPNKQDVQNFALTAFHLLQHIGIGYLILYFLQIPLSETWLPYILSYVGGVSYIWTAQQLDVVKNLHRKIERYTFIFTPGLGWYLLGVGIVLFVFITEKRPAYLAISFLAYGRPAYEFVREVLQRYGPKNRFFQSQAIPFLVNVIICTILTWVYETRTGYFVSVWNFFADKIVGRNYFRIIACGVIGGLANLEFSEKQRPFMNLQVPVATAVLVRLYEKLQLMM